MTDYKSFLASKRSYRPDAGFNVEPDELNPALKPFQSDCVRYDLRRGACLLAEECGLGKTVQQLEIAYQVAKRTKGLYLIFCPLCVAQQTLREAEKFNIGRGWMPIMVAKAHDEIPFVNGIVITNYEKRSKFDARKFAGVCIDEGSILKSFTGRIKQDLCREYAETPFKTSATATPSPNDILEIGNQSEFLGVLPSREMISRWFINDSMNAGKYRLKGHAEADFWDWVSSWAVSLETPSDLGYPDDDYILPPLTIHEHEVQVEDPDPPAGQLFCNEPINATNIHRDKRRSAAARSEVVAGLVNNSTVAWVIWCETDYEAIELVKRIPEAVEVRGSFPESTNVRAIDAFSLGLARVIVCKPSSCGWGLNWQHSWHSAHVGTGWSFEGFYQAMRRQYRFGQRNHCYCHVVNSQAESVTWRTVKRKWNDHKNLKRSMSGAMLSSQMERVRGKLRLADYKPGKELILPEWMKARAS